jgi:hypothetical protein
MKICKWTWIGPAVAGLILIVGRANQHAHADLSHHDHDHTRPPDAVKLRVSTPEQVAQAKAYPLDGCVVSDGKLGSMGDRVVRVHDGQVVSPDLDSNLGFQPARRGVGRLQPPIWRVSPSIQSDAGTASFPIPVECGTS